MYTIVMQEDKSLIVTQAVTIYQRETNVNTLCFLVFPTITEEGEQRNIAEYLVVLKMKTPDGKVLTQLLTANTETYKDRLRYEVAVTADMTAVAGKITAYLTFLKVSESETGLQKEHVFHSGNAYITVQPKEDFVFIPDKSLQAFDQLMLQTQAKLDQLEDIAESIDTQKADNIVLDPDTNEIYLTSNGEIIGNKITIDELSDVIVDATADEGLIHVIT